MGADMLDLARQLALAVDVSLLGRPRTMPLLLPRRAPVTDVKLARVKSCPVPLQEVQ